MREIDTIDLEMLQINEGTLLGWAVWCCDGREIQKYNSKEHDWVDIPKIGVQYMYRIFETHLEQVGGCDYYCPYQLMNVDDVSPWIKFGLMIDQTILNSIFEEVRNFNKSDFEAI